MAVAMRRTAFLCFGLLLACKSFAAPPANITPDPELQGWFKALRQPLTTHLCCAVSDCRFVAFWTQDGHYEVQIEGWRYAVPTDTIIGGIANPTGRAVACYTLVAFGLPLPNGVPRDKPQDTIEILCFVPPRPTS
jgi:hypothetical protein